MRHLLLILSATALIAGEAAPAPVTAPAPTVVPGAQRPPMLGRGSVYEVEQLTITPGDAAGLAAWAEHGARGWHLITVVAQDGKQVLFFERPMQAGSEPYVPAAVAADPARGEAVRDMIRRIIAERMPSRRPQPTPDAQ